MIHAVIFDLDGTLLDSMSVWEQVDQRFLRENGIVPPPGISDTIKRMEIEEAAAYIIGRFSLPLTPQQVIDRIEALAAEEYGMHLQLKPHVPALLDLLDSAGISYCIATATYRSLVSSALERLGIASRFQFVLTCMEVGAGKTEPQIYQQAAARLGFAPAEVLVIEDGLHCIETAKVAGFPVVGVFDSVAAADWAQICACCDFAADSLAALLPMVKTRFAQIDKQTKI